MTTETQKAIEDLKKLDPKPGCPVGDGALEEYEQACSVFMILEYDRVLRALTLLDRVERGEVSNDVARAWETPAGYQFNHSTYLKFTATLLREIEGEIG